MNVYIDSNFVGSTCLGCLSTDRRLFEIQEREHKKYFAQLLDASVDIEVLELCWECTAHIRNALKFKTRVNLAAELYSKYTQSCTLSPLSLTTLVSVCLELEKEPEPQQEPELLTSIKEETDTQYEGFFHSPSPEIKEDPPLELRASKRSPSIDSDDIPLTKISKKSTETKKLKVEEPIKTKKVKIKDKLKKPKTGVVTNKRVLKKLQEMNVDPKDIEMVILTWEEVEAERQKVLESDAFKRYAYKCYNCVIGFNHKFKLENHMKKHEEGAGVFSCGWCGVRFAGEWGLAGHRRRHVSRWRCRVCAATVSRAAVAADHAAREHGARVPQHGCSLCGYKAQSLGKLRIHLKNHKERQKCELCGKSFRDRTSLRTHLFIHKGEKEYSCSKCDKKFLFKKAMEIHMVTHEAPAGLYCYDCDMNFKNKMSYYQHMKYNLKHVDPDKLKYACDVCDRRFVKATRLHEHRVAIHLKTTPVRCEVQDCNFACSSRPVLRTHVRMVHLGRRNLRNHVCHTCGKAYTTKKTLEGHMRTHTGERPFHCTLCPSTFGYEAALYNHNRLVHLKVKRTHH